jgi:hypothetical protein
MKNIYKYGDFLTEKIRSSEAHDPMSAIQTVIDGKRDLAFLATMDDPRYNPGNIYELRALVHGVVNGLRVLEVPGKKDGNAYIAYREGSEAQAQKLSDYAASKGGYLSDSNPEEARYVGTLLGYDERDIESFVQRIYGSSN